LIACVACLLMAVLLVGAVDEYPEATLLKEINEQNLNGAGLYKHGVEVSNGIHQIAQGDVNGVTGEYFLPGEDGEPPLRVTYTADASGFHADVQH
ncbi:hypothetical protein KR044_000998, partial [Drosophila immigrans]